MTAWRRALVCVMGAAPLLACTPSDAASRGVVVLPFTGEVPAPTESLPADAGSAKAASEPLTGCAAWNAANPQPPTFSRCLSVGVDGERPEYWIATFVARRQDGLCDWTLTHVDAHGERSVLPVVAMDPPPTDVDPDTTYDVLPGATEAFAEFDWDEDGEPDLLFMQQRSVPEQLRPPGILVSAQGGKAHALFQPPPGLYLDGVVDTDDDGRPDLRLFMVLGGLGDQGCGGPGTAESSESFIARSLPGGSFDLADPVSQDIVREWCDKPPVRPHESSEILCARIWNPDDRSLERTLKREYDACEKTRAAHYREYVRKKEEGCFDERCNEERDRWALSQVKPPLQLR